MKRSKKNSQKQSQEKKGVSLSNGKQVEKPNKIKNVSAEEKILHSQQTKDHSLQANAIDVICKSMDYVKIKVFSGSNAASVPPEKKSSVILPRFSISSVTAKECCSNINVDQNVGQGKSQGPGSDTICYKNSEAKELLNARCLKVILHKWYENGAKVAPAQAVEVCFCSCLNGLPVDQVKESDSEPATRSGSRGRTTNSAIPILAKVIIEPGTEADKNLVPVLKKVDKTNALKSKKENCAALATPVNNTIRGRNTVLSGSKTFGGDDSSHIFEDDEMILLDALYKSSVENTQRKRICSGNKENIHCKRVKTSDEIKPNTCAGSKKEGNLLEKIKLMIHERMEVLNSDFFNHKLEGLSGRVEQAQCLKKHEELARTFLKKVAKLERRINAVITFQKKVLSKVVGHQTRLPSADSQNTILNHLGSSASFPNIINVQQSISSKLLLPSHSGFTSACVSEDASCDEVSGEGQNSATANNSDIPNNQVYTQAATSAPTQRTYKIITDVSSLSSSFTRRSPQTIRLLSRSYSPVTFYVGCCEPGKTENAQESVLHKRNSKPMCFNSACMKLTAETSYEDPKRFPHLPPLRGSLRVQNLLKNSETLSLLKSLN